MTQVHNALAYYWTLRDQGISPENAREHARLRFGVILDSDPLASTAEVVGPQTGRMSCANPNLSQPVSLRMGSDFCKTLYGCGTDGRQGP